MSKVIILLPCKKGSQSHLLEIQRGGGELDLCDLIIW